VLVGVLLLSGHHTILPAVSPDRGAMGQLVDDDDLCMTAHTVHLPGPAAHRSFRLTPREVRTEQQPDVVLPAMEAQALLLAAKQEDVSKGGCFSPGPAGVQVWDGPWNGVGGRVGTAAHLGSVDWSWDQPAEGFVTIYRVLLTAAGAKAGLTTNALLDTVLRLTGLRPLQAVLPLPRRSAEALHHTLA